MYRRVVELSWGLKCYFIFTIECYGQSILNGRLSPHLLECVPRGSGRLPLHSGGLTAVPF